MTDYMQEALKMNEQLVLDRRTVHQYAELAFDMPRTVAYVEKELKAAGITPIRVGKAGVSGLIGSGEPCILLRADMDALPMDEESGLPFAAPTGSCHSCGHDCHVTMLLGAARLLKAHEAELKGTVKLMFQPAEEILGGAEDMIKNGIMENPKVDAAIGMHVTPGEEPYSCLGNVSFKRGYSTMSGDFVRVSVVGKQAHGSTPEAGVDAISIACHIALALQELSSREVSNIERSVVLVGKIVGGSSCNTMSGECTLDVSVRAASAERRSYLKQRVKEISEGIAMTFRGKAIVEFVYGMPPMYNHPDMTSCVPGYLKELIGAEHVCEFTEFRGTEDFTAVAELVPSIFLHIGSGHAAGEDITCHNPKILFDEDVLHRGAAVYAYTAARYLEDHC